MRTELDYVAGETSTLACTYQGVNISGYTITLRVDRTPADTVLSKTATIVSGPAGTFSFAWASGDLIAGYWPAQLRVDDGLGGLTVFDGLFVRVAEAL